MLDGESAKSSVVKCKLIHQKDFRVNKAYISMFMQGSDLGHWKVYKCSPIPLWSLFGNINCIVFVNRFQLSMLNIFRCKSVVA